MHTFGLFVYNIALIIAASEYTHTYFGLFDTAFATLMNRWMEINMCVSQKIKIVKRAFNIKEYLSTLYEHGKLSLTSFS